MDPLVVASSTVAVVMTGVTIAVTVRKTSSEVASIATATALSWASAVAGLQTQLEAESTSRRKLQEDFISVHSEVAAMKRMLATYRKGVNLLIEQIAEAGLKPAWYPPPPEKEPTTR